MYYCFFFFVTFLFCQYMATTLCSLIFQQWTKQVSSFNSTLFKCKSEIFIWKLLFFCWATEMRKNSLQQKISVPQHQDCPLRGKQSKMFGWSRTQTAGETVSKGLLACTRVPWISVSCGGIVFLLKSHVTFSLLLKNGTDLMPAQELGGDGADPDFSTLVQIIWLQKWFQNM